MKLIAPIYNTDLNTPQIEIIEDDINTNDEWNEKRCVTQQELQNYILPATDECITIFVNRKSKLISADGKHDSKYVTGINLEITFGISEYMATKIRNISSSQELRNFQLVFNLRDSLKNIVDGVSNETLDLPTSEISYFNNFFGHCYFDEYTQFINGGSSQITPALIRHTDENLLSFLNQDRPIYLLLDQIIEAQNLNIYNYYVLTYKFYLDIIGWGTISDSGMMLLYYVCSYYGIPLIDISNETKNTGNNVNILYENSTSIKFNMLQDNNSDFLKNND